VQYDRTSALLNTVMFDQKPTRAQINGPQVATIVSATADACYFTIPTMPGNNKYGPAPYPHDAPTDSTIPAPGTSCLVVFVGANVNTPWVVAIDWEGVTTSTVLSTLQGDVTALQAASTASGSVVQDRMFSSNATANNVGYATTTYGQISEWPAPTITKKFAGTTIILDVSARQYIGGTAGQIAYNIWNSATGLAVGDMVVAGANDVGIYFDVRFGANVVGLPAGSIEWVPYVRTSGTGTSWNIGAGQCPYTIRFTEVWP
jgi:hypothetical protein